MQQTITMDRLIEFVTNHHFLFIGLLVVSILLLQDIISGLFRKYKSTTPNGAIELLNNDAAVLDVREPFEYNKGHIANAVNMTYAKLDEKVDTLQVGKNHALIVTCKTGTQSSHACKKLSKLGFEKVYHLTGGMQAWQDNNLPVEKTKQ